MEGPNKHSRATPRRIGRFRRSMIGRDFKAVIGDDASKPYSKKQGRALPIPPSVLYDLQTAMDADDAEIFKTAIEGICQSLTPQIPSGTTSAGSRKESDDDFEEVEELEEQQEQEQEQDHDEYDAYSDDGGDDFSQQNVSNVRPVQETADIIDNIIVDVCGYHILHKAAISGRPNITAAALILGSNADFVCGERMMTPLLIAASTAHNTVFSTLLQQGADVTVKDNKQWNVLHHAVQSDDLSIVKLVVKSIDLLETPCDQGMTALHLACHRGNLDIVQFLIDSGAAINAQCSNEYTPAHYAVNSNQLEIFDLLFSKGCKVRVSNPQQNIMALASKVYYDVPYNTFKNKEITSQVESEADSASISP